MRKWEMNQDCLIEAISLQEQYFSLHDHKLCVTASIQVKEKAGDKYNEGLVGEALRV